MSNEALRTDSFPEENGLFRQITHDPVGVVYVIVGAVFGSILSLAEANSVESSTFVVTGPWNYLS